MSLCHIVQPGSKVRLAEIDTKPSGDWTKERALQEIERIRPEFERLEDIFAFAGIHAILIVLQGMDTAGKDGAGRHLFGMSNILSARVAGFKKPTEEELAHDFLWRVHKQVPRKGELVLFNRSHYEDVLVVRVHQLVPEDVIEARYSQINQFEDLLLSSGVLMLKFFLHISKEEQEARLLDREQDPAAAWKLAVGDWQERERWDDYQRAYEIALERCSTEAAPWSVVPADKKWFRNLAVTQAVIDTMKAKEKDWTKSLAKRGEEAKAALTAYRSQA